MPLTVAPQFTSAGSPGPSVPRNAYVSQYRRSITVPFAAILLMRYCSRKCVSGLLFKDENFSGRESTGNCCTHAQQNTCGRPTIYRYLVDCLTKTSCSGLPSISATGTATNSIQACCSSAASNKSRSPGQQHRRGCALHGLQGDLQFRGAGGGWQGTQQLPLLPVLQGNAHPPAGSTELL